MEWGLVDETNDIVQSIALSPMGFEAKKQEFCSMKESGHTEVTECEEQEIELPAMYQGTHKMGSSELKCLVYEVDRPAYPTFFLLKPVRHRSVVRHETFYEENGNLKVVILSSVDCLLQDLITPDQASIFFTSTGSGSGLTKLFRTIILDTCSGLEHLFELDLYPKKIDLGDLYVCKDGPTKKRVQLLILEAQKIERKKTLQARRTLLWGHVRLIIEEIREITQSDELIEVDKRFVESIGKGVNMLSQYPHSWSDEQKGRYLISIISADIKIVYDKLEKSDLEWPGKQTKTPHLLELLMKNASTRTKPYPYCTEVPYDYVHLCRTTFKHFPSLCKEVPALKEMCQKREDFLRLMETWQPLIWCLLYDAIGLVARYRFNIARIISWLLI